MLKTAAALRRKRRDTGRRAAPARSPERAKQGAPRRKKKLTYKSSVLAGARDEGRGSA